jgi:hypothetical protein
VRRDVQGRDARDEALVTIAPRDKDAVRERNHHVITIATTSYPITERPATSTQALRTLSTAGFDPFTRGGGGSVVTLLASAASMGAAF